MTVQEACAALREEIRDFPWFFECLPRSSGGQGFIVVLEHDFAPHMPRYHAYAGFPVARWIVRPADAEATP